MDPSLVDAFKKLEGKLKKEKENAARKEREEAFRLSQEKLERERKRQERIIYAGCFTFVLALVVAIYYANEDQIQANGGVGGWMAFKVGGFANSLKSSTGYSPSGSNGSSQYQESSDLDCTKPENWKDPACINQRKNEVESKWQSMALNRGGKEKAFSIHSEGN